MFLLKHFIASSVHLGHPIHRWNPRSSFFLLGIRDGIHIIDLEQTILMFRRALHFIQQVCFRRGFIFFDSSFHALSLVSKRHTFLLPEVILLFSISSSRSLVLIKEALKLQIPVIAVLDSDSNPFGIQFPIPGNSFSVDSLHFYSDLFANSILSAKKLEISGF